MKTLSLWTNQREEMLNISGELRKAALAEGWTSGALHIFCPHTTCGLTINEGADPAVQQDLMRFFGEIAPFEHGWKHFEGNTDAHVRASLLGSSLLIPLDEKGPVLGRWQSVFLYEGDGPRQRSLLLQRLG